MDLKTIAGAAALVALLATPALSQTTAPNDAAAAAKSGADSSMGMNGKTGSKMKTERHPQRHMGKMEHHPRHKTVHSSAVRRDRLVGPGDVAAGIVGGAVGTAAAIATSPFGALENSYAYYGSGYAPQPQPFKFDDNGPTCQPGTWVTLNGLKYPCQ